MDGMNPIRDAGIPRAAKALGETYAVSADEVLAILDVLARAKEFQARAAVALVFFAGLDPARLAEQGGKTTTVRNSRSSNPFGVRTRTIPEPLVLPSPCRSLNRCGNRVRSRF
jgi:hypothetical protein